MQVVLIMGEAQQKYEFSFSGKIKTSLSASVSNMAESKSMSNILEQKLYLQVTDTYINVKICCIKYLKIPVNYLSSKCFFKL